VSRTISAALAATAAALALGGCYGVSEEHAVQQDAIGDAVRLDAAFEPLDESPGRLPGQFLAAFLVPEDAAAPATLEARLPGAAAPVAMARKPSLDESLQATRPAPGGRRWVGYISAVVALPDGVTSAEDVDDLVRDAATAAPPAAADARWSVGGDFGIARGDGGLPAPTTFDHAAMGGHRVAFPAALLDPGAPPSDDVRAFALGLRDRRPVDCEEARAFPFPTLFGVERSAAVPTTSCGPTSPGGSLALADLRGAGGTVTAAPGETVAVPFALRSVGPAGPVYALSAGTTLPGGDAVPGAATLEPGGPGFHEVTVALTVPADAEPGAHEVSLVATTAAGQRREAIGTLVVRAPVPGGLGEPELQGVLGITIHQEDAPLLRFSPFTRAVPGRRGAVAVGNAWCLNQRAPCDVRVQLRAGGVLLGTARLRVPAQARRRVTIRTGRRARALLRWGRSVDAVVSLRRATDPAPVVGHVSLRRRP
jgi:hypothetical protein